MLFSDSESNELVASSNINNVGSLYSSLAIKILCFCPPDNNMPLSPTVVLNPSGRELIKSSILAFFAAFIRFI